MKDIPHRQARFRTVIALFLKGQIYYFEGIVEGEIAEKPHGEKGFGYDPIFIPKDTDDEQIENYRKQLEDKLNELHEIAKRDYKKFLKGELSEIVP